MNLETQTQDKSTAVMPFPNMLRVSQDGVEFINVDMQAETQLGRMLAPFSHTQFMHPYYGPFHSIVGYSFWLSTGMMIDALRYASGSSAKRLGRRHPTIRYNAFRDDLRVGHWLKITQSKTLSELLPASHLRFESYYIFGPERRLVGSRDREFLIETLSEIRECLQQGTEPEFWKRSQERYAENCANGETPQEASQHDKADEN